jgi:alkanesulfonate monooxygenase SsuD/methylene tetrahydromethanopterin reductase-like flavin-dependent oxidoreductase (luciferase family)
MKFAIYASNVGGLADVRRLAELASGAEETGFDGFFISDWMLPSASSKGGSTAVADVQVALSAIALATSRIRFGAMVSPLPRRRPVKFAREALSLDRLSDGRLVIGAGSGHEVETEFGQLGEPTDARARADRLDEMLQVLDGLLRGDEVSFAGEHITVRRTRLADPRSQKPRIPFWLGALPDRPRTLRRAARWEGLFALRSDFSLMSPADVARMRDYVLANRDTSEPFDIAVAARFPDNAPDPEPEIIADYERAGATWWLQHAWTPQQANDLITRGRPKP